MPSRSQARMVVSATPRITATSLGLSSSLGLISGAARSVITLIYPSRYHPQVAVFNDFVISLVIAKGSSRRRRKRAPACTGCPTGPSTFGPCRHNRPALKDWNDVLMRYGSEVLRRELADDQVDDVEQLAPAAKCRKQCAGRQRRSRPWVSQHAPDDRAANTPARDDRAAGPTSERAR
jgi:hypothetical protein